ncbi:MAG: tautomerase family protein [Azospirillum sp.]|nr:tautomerase family protein [Azospirillum sp.]
MPLVRISLKRGDPARRRAVADGVHRALVETVGVPPDDRFQVITSHDEDLVYDPNYLGIRRSDDVVLIQIFLSTGRTVDQKKALYRSIADRLAADPGLRPEDVFVNLVETTRADWSFGNGIAQYADAPPPHLVAAPAA